MRRVLKTGNGETLKVSDRLIMQLKWYFIKIYLAEVFKLNESE